MSTPTGVDPRVSGAYQQALVAEYAAVFGYGVLGPRLTDVNEQTQARTDEQSHRDLIATTQTRLTAANLTPIEPQVSYPLPYPVQDADTARRFALRLESLTAAAWRYLIASAAGAGSTQDLAMIRTDAATALTAAAVREVGWRRLITPSNPTVPFPGT